MRDIFTHLFFKAASLIIHITRCSTHKSKHTLLLYPYKSTDPFLACGAVLSGIQCGILIHLLPRLDPDLFSRIVTSALSFSLSIALFKLGSSCTASSLFLFVVQDWICLWCSFLSLSLSLCLCAYSIVSSWYSHGFVLFFLFCYAGYCCFVFFLLGPSRLGWLWVCTR